MSMVPPKTPRHGRTARDRRRRRHRPERPAAPVVPEVTRLASATDVGEALTAAEIDEMKEHLGFVRRYKDMLRIKLNAVEDLLVNGHREPTDRGVCRHLLGKVDRTVIDAALAREPLRSDAGARARMLAGAVRLTADAGVLLAYLEALAHVRSRAEAAAAFAEVVRRIDFTSLSPARLVRLLQVLVTTFEGHERVQVLFGLLGSTDFRRAFDTATAALPDDVAGVFSPLRAIHRRLGREGDAGDDATLVARGLEAMLSAPDPVLRAQPADVRAGVVRLALEPDVPETVADRAAGVLLGTLAGTAGYGRLALKRAAQLLARHADDRARVVLAELRRSDPGMRVVERWLAALDARRLGRVALEGSLPARGRLVAGLWLDGQRTVWARTAPVSDGTRLETEARLQDALALPGIAPVVAHGVASGIPYVAVAGPGRPFARDAVAHDPHAALVAAAAGARALRALALAGVLLPDAEPERFLYAAPAGLVLADLDGARRSDPAAAESHHAGLARELTRQLVAARIDSLGREAAHAVGTVLDTATGLVVLIGALDRALLGRHAESR
jgi:hypothetical protein